MQGAEVHKCKGKVDSYSVNPTALTAGAATVLPLLVATCRLAAQKKRPGGKRGLALALLFSLLLCR